MFLNLVARFRPPRAVRIPSLAPSPSRSLSSTRFKPRRGARYGLATTAAVTCLGAIYVIRIRDESRRIQLDSDQKVKLLPTNKDLIPMSEVEKHNNRDDLWVVINGKVYDLTRFAEDHPGGAAAIYQAAGKDASHIYNPLHPPGTIENGLDEDALIGLVDPATVKQVTLPASEEPVERISLSEIVGLPDFDAAAKQNLTPKAWAYMSAGGTDEYTLGLNRSSFNQILFRPRILVDVDVVDTRTQMMGQETTLPVFICPAGMAKLSHPEGEVLLAQGAGLTGLIQMISTNASAPLNDIINGATHPDQPFFMQLYVDKKRHKSEALVEKINGHKQLKAVFVTVDASAPGKREKDERLRSTVAVASGISGGKIATDNKGGGIGRSVGGFIDPKLSWDDIKWLRKHTQLPIGLKGVQSVEDVKKAYDLGIDAVYLSNHGGRALDGSPPALYTLLELNKFYPEIVKDKRCEIYIDGGIRRGTDVVKALCLGANGVGMGRPFLYALTYGTEGVVHAIEIMRDEVETTMRLLGVTKLSQLGPHLLNTKALDPLLADSPMYAPGEQVK